MTKLPNIANLARQAADTAAALKQAEAAAKAAKEALKAQRPSQTVVIRRAIIEDESITVDALLTKLAAIGFPAAKKDMVTLYRSDALAFLRLLRSMGRLVETSTEAPAEAEKPTETSSEPLLGPRHAQPKSKGGVNETI